MSNDMKLGLIFTVILIASICLIGMIEDPCVTGGCY